MWKSIVVPVDGSTFAEKIIPWAIRLASPETAIHLVHIHVPPPPMIVEGVVVADPSIDQTLREQESNYLVELQTRLREAAPSLNFVARNIETDTSLVDALTKAVEATSAELVIMSTHARGPFARFWLGSVCNDFLIRSPVPILMERFDDDEPADFSSPATLEQLIIPLDGTEYALGVLDAARKLGDDHSIDYRLLLTPSAIHEEDVDYQLQQFGIEAERVAGMAIGPKTELYGKHVATHHLADRNVSVQLSELVDDSASQTILQLGGKNRQVGIAMTTHGRSVLSRLLMGSVTHEVIQQARGPILIYQPKAD